MFREESTRKKEIGNGVAQNLDIQLYCFNFLKILKITNKREVMNTVNRAWVFYDGECGVCLRAMGILHRVVWRSHFEEAKLQEGWVKRLFGLDPNVVPEEMKLLTCEREALGGLDALMYLAGLVWWMRPLKWVLGRAKVYPLAKAAYRWFAVNRYCVNGACRRLID